MYDVEKRRRIIGRSQELGHCICNPKQPCPCEMLKEKNVCLCAGERPEDIPDNVPLTQFVENAGCASKINQNDLKQALAGLPEISDPRVLVNADTSDDAGVYKLNEELALVQTVDVFTPGVDDPFLFGRIAACNSLSDVYAMGGAPITALSVIGFPIYSLPHEVMAEILRGGMSVLEEAGAILLGGAFSAIGIFSSSLTRNQIISFIIGLVLCLLLVLIDKFLFFLPASALGFAEYLSANYHFRNFARGIIDSRDIIYFISVMAIGIVGTIQILEERR